MSSFSIGHYFPLQNIFQVFMTHWDILVLNFQRVVKVFKSIFRILYWWFHSLTNGSKIIQFQRKFDSSHLILNVPYSWSKVQTLKHPMCKVGIHVWVMGMCPFDSWTISLKFLGKCCIFLTFILFWTCIQPNSSLSFHLGCYKQCTHN
jgi:hypothetical protein